MKAIYTTASGRLRFEVEGETVKAVFPLLASIQEVFDAESECGMCQSADISLQARKVDSYDFYELRCNKCRARFQFGQAKTGGNLFPKRRDDDGRSLDHGGWSRYVPEGQAPPEPAVGERYSRTTPTPEGLQSSFDRLGVMFNKTAPTRIGPALDLIRDQMRDTAGSRGTAEFDRIYRNWEGLKPDRTIAGSYKGLLKSLVEALEQLSLGVNA